uniref:Uncharacterized protein n=1 Tax=Anguilla anguilla TaxID=7936 RepID=A0A0E9UUF7_ANGAN
MGHCRRAKRSFFFCFSRAYEFLRFVCGTPLAITKGLFKHKGKQMHKICTFKVNQVKCTHTNKLLLYKLFSNI